MLIDISQLHNLVRIYQRGLQCHDDTERNTDRMSPQSTADHVSLSAEARQHLGFIPRREGPTIYGSPCQPIDSSYRE